MIQGKFKVIENWELAPGIWEMQLEGRISREVKPGQFVNILLPGKFLRRPISICNIEYFKNDVSSGNDSLENETGSVNDSLENRKASLLNGIITIIYKVVGSGTEDMSKMPIGSELNLLAPLGNGYDLEDERIGKRPLLIGGGSGIPPLYLLAKKLIEAGKKVHVIMGFNKEEEIYYLNEFNRLGAKVTLTTVDGSYGIKGFVTDGIEELKNQGKDFSYFFSCGPGPMLKAVYEGLEIPGQMSFEERMGCGFGACMGCSLPVKDGYKRVCKDGPIFKKEEVLPWTD